MITEYKKTLLIDLDGVLNTYTGNFDKDFIPEICPSKFCDKPEGCEQNLGVVTLKSEQPRGSDELAQGCETRLDKTGAKEFLEELSKDYEIKIFTTRNRLLTSKWLIKNELDSLVTDVTNIKDPAYLHIDDRCICFNGDFKNTINEIKNFKAYWK